ncbi:hypothetical protein EJ110_NYTH58519 [Nymphaea thermarum]|nr:hypothetical protein EJ110_NYTH58519 [Nymphaea thermarum]
MLNMANLFRCAIDSWILIKFSQGSSTNFYKPENIDKSGVVVKLLQAVRSRAATSLK